MADTQFKFTIDLLKEYSAAALTNAAALLEEASMLLSHGHKARAYFLAVAAIEETGKAVLAFDGQGRNLRDSAVTVKLRHAMEDHSQKITAAFTPALKASPNLRDALMPLINLVIDVRRGREPSMYTDINYISRAVNVPSSVVRDVAAQDCVRLARDCFATARAHITEKTPPVSSRTDDAFFAMKSEQMKQILKTEDFWMFYLAQMVAGIQDFSAAVISYQTEYISKGRLWKARGTL